MSSVPAMLGRAETLDPTYKFRCAIKTTTYSKGAKVIIDLGPLSGEQEARPARDHRSGF